MPRRGVNARNIGLKTYRNVHFEVDFVTVSSTLCIRPWTVTIISVKTRWKLIHPCVYFVEKTLWPFTTRPINRDAISCAARPDGQQNTSKHSKLLNSPISRSIGFVLHPMPSPRPPTLHNKFVVPLHFLLKTPKRDNMTWRRLQAGSTLSSPTFFVPTEKHLLQSSSPWPRSASPVPFTFVSPLNKDVDTILGMSFSSPSDDSNYSTSTIGSPRLTRTKDDIDVRDIVTNNMVVAFMSILTNLCYSERNPTKTRPEFNALPDTIKFTLYGTQLTSVNNGSGWKMRFSKSEKQWVSTGGAPLITIQVNQS